MAERAPAPLRKRFGRHFLADDAVVDAIIALVAPAAGDHILEIGPGGGVLTAPLAASGAHLEVVEIDRDLAAWLAGRFGGSERFVLHNQDVLKFDFARLPAVAGGWKVVGNLPYNISTPLLMRLLEEAGRLRELTLMVQREVGERLAAAPATAAYGRLGVMAQRRARIALRLEVPPHSFEPPPKVDSAVVQLYPSAGPFAADFERDFAEVVRLAFGARRKTLANALKRRLAGAQMEALGIDPGSRAEVLSVDDFVRLTAALREHA
ncbi:MAG: 16S rRNA (adenine(1518)-N(6)/adenine(1519)-N(6))-dimethyltransferase RsmA [Gammaproteobacteria bacterium]